MIQASTQLESNHANAVNWVQTLVRNTMLRATFCFATALSFGRAVAKGAPVEIRQPGTVAITSVDVTTVNELGRRNPPLTREAAAEATGTGLALRYARGEVIDAAFIARSGASRITSGDNVEPDRITSSLVNTTNKDVVAA